MQVSNYEVIIHEGHELENGQVLMHHDTKYSIALVNQSLLNCDAEITIDGKVIGLFRVKPLGTIILNRGTEDNGRFTFYANKTDEFYKSQLSKVDTNLLGLISVTFFPEMPPKLEQKASTLYEKPSFQDVIRKTKNLKNHSYNEGFDRSYSNLSGYGDAISGAAVGSAIYSKGLNSGGTGLSGKSNQLFGKAKKIEYDYDNVVQINLRLVERKSFNEPRPLKGIRYSNPIPPSV